jgi:CheY-like chemotaxis protein
LIQAVIVLHFAEFDFSDSFFIAQPLPLQPSNRPLERHDKLAIQSQAGAGRPPDSYEVARTCSQGGSDGVRAHASMTGIDEGRATCICVVDDDAGVRHAMAALLSAAGYRVVTFACGADLLTWPDLANVEVAIFDVHMPAMDGFALQRRCVEQGVKARILFFSGHADAGLALLRKPVDPERLLEQIESALDSDASKRER